MFDDSCVLRFPRPFQTWNIWLVISNDWDFDSLVLGSAGFGSRDFYWHLVLDLVHGTFIGVVSFHVFSILVVFGPGASMSSRQKIRDVLVWTPKHDLFLFWKHNMCKPELPLFVHDLLTKYLIG
jgi:hypothetical protein